MAYGMVVDRVCNLCGLEVESRDHLFFQCAYSRRVWESLLQACLVHRNVLSWHQELIWTVNNLKGKSLQAIVFKLAWNGYIYAIWRDRNCRQFRGCMRAEDDIVHQDVECVQMKLKGKCVNAIGIMNSSICSRWSLTV
ncbi:hypothetical protein V6N13_119784 [Hibiscus sabdariffa]